MHFKMEKTANDKLGLADETQWEKTPSLTELQHQGWDLFLASKAHYTFTFRNLWICVANTVRPTFQQ